MNNNMVMCVFGYVFETKNPKPMVIPSFYDWSLFCHFRMYILTLFMYTQPSFMCIALTFMYVSSKVVYIIKLLSTFRDNVQCPFLTVPLDWFTVHLQLITVHLPVTHVQKLSGGCTL